MWAPYAHFNTLSKGITCRRLKASAGHKISSTFALKGTFSTQLCLVDSFGTLQRLCSPWTCSFRVTFNRLFPWARKALIKGSRLKCYSKSFSKNWTQASIPAICFARREDQPVLHLSPQPFVKYHSSICLLWDVACLKPTCLQPPETSPNEGKSYIYIFIFKQIYVERNHNGLCCKDHTFWSCRHSSCQPQKAFLRGSSPPHKVVKPFDLVQAKNCAVLVEDMCKLWGQVVDLNAHMIWSAPNQIRPFLLSSKERSDLHALPAKALSSSGLKDSISQIRFTKSAWTIDHWIIDARAVATRHLAKPHQVLHKLPWEACMFWDTRWFSAWTVGNDSKRDGEQFAACAVFSQLPKTCQVQQQQVATHTLSDLDHRVGGLQRRTL